jgi:hypothetical protein
MSTRPKLGVEIHTQQLANYGTSLQNIFGLIAVENYKVLIQWDDDQHPVDYNMRTPIAKCVHLFGIVR